MSIDHLKQLFEANECSGLVEAYVDSIGNRIMVGALFLAA